MQAHHRSIPSWARLLPFSFVLLFVPAACGDDASDAGSTSSADDPTVAASPEPATTESPADGTGDAPPNPAEPDQTDPAPTEYCAIATELFNQDGFPTSAQLADYAAAAPDEIAATVAVLLPVFEDAADDPSKLFNDPDVVAAIDEITAFEATACGLGEVADPAATDPDATVIDVAATDYAFDVELPSEPGAYSFVMTNDGTEPHLMILVQLEPDVSIEDVMASEGETGVLASHESAVAAPGSTAVVSAELAPGRWVLVCPIPDSDGVSHADHGMVVEFTVA